MQLNTAPLLLLYPPTVGPNSKPDGQPARYEFSSGCVTLCSTTCTKSMLTYHEQPSERRSRTSVDFQIDAWRCSSPSHQPPHQLREDHHRHHHRPRSSNYSLRRRTLCTAAPAEPQPLGRYFSLHHHPVLLRTHVQPHSWIAVRGQRRKGRSLLLCWRLPEPVRS